MGKEPLLEVPAVFFSKVLVYKDGVTLKTLFGLKETHIPVRKITSISKGIFNSIKINISDEDYQISPWDSSQKKVLYKKLQKITES